MKFEKVAVLGAGTIGMSWAALFAASGREVAVYDPAEGVEQRVRAMVASTADTLRELGWDKAGDTSRISFFTDPAEAVAGADFIQENVPERLEIKHDTYARIEPALAPGAIIGSSTSGLRLSEMQKGFADPSRFVLTHPFNPPHLIPLVELMGNEATAEGVLAETQAFYESLGKVCVFLNKEVPGHIANRLQVAIWREAINLAVEGVASVGDIDKAVAYGPGLRWAAMGPTTLFHLGGGAGGIRGFCDHLAGPVQSWWNDLGRPDLTPEVIDTLAKGVDEAVHGETLDQLAAERDKLILGYLKTRAALD